MAMAGNASASGVQGVVKAGWLQRESDILKRWKPNYFVLFMDGGLAYYKDETRREMEGSIYLPTNCNFIKVGEEVTSVQAPPNCTNGCLLELQTNKNSMFLCMDSPDDAVAWKASLIEVKNANVRSRSAPAAPNGPPMGYAPAPGQPPVYMQTPPAYAPQPPVCAPQPPVCVSQPPVYAHQPPAYATQSQPTQQIVYSTTYATNPCSYRRQYYRNGYPVQTMVHQYPGQMFGTNGVQIVPTAYASSSPFQLGPGQVSTVVYHHQYPPYLPY